jgi:hypothetical protein
MSLRSFWVLRNEIFWIGESIAAGDFIRVFGPLWEARPGEIWTLTKVPRLMWILWTDDHGTRGVTMQEGMTMLNQARR